MTKSRTAIVTGGSKGIGLTVAKILAKKKYNIVICSRSSADLTKAKKIIESLGVKCLALKTDVSNYVQCTTLIKSTIKKFSKIDLLVNNAGVQGPIGNFWTSNIKNWFKTFEINLLGTVYMSHLVIPYMLRSKSGMIFNFSGGGGAYARPLFTAYGTSKTAVLRFTETLAQELINKNITVFAIAPGTVWTNMAKEVLSSKGKLLDKKTIAELKFAKITGGTSEEKLERLILFLLKEKSEKLSGKLVHVNEIDKIKKNWSKINSESGLLRRRDYR